jgi:hypothetical protein
MQLCVVSVRGQHKACLSVRITGVDVCSAMKKLVDGVDVSLLDCVPPRGVHSRPSPANIN